MSDRTPRTRAERDRTPPYRFEPLSVEHDVATFDCGDTAEARVITEYLRDRALTEHVAGLNSVTVALDTATRELVAYFTLSPISLPVGPQMLHVIGVEGSQYRSVGGFLLGRLGVAAGRQGSGVGTALIVKATRQAAAARDEHGVGGAFLAVDPKTERLVAWYTSLGFVRLDPSRRRVVRALESLGAR